MENKTQHSRLGRREVLLGGAAFASQALLGACGTPPLPRDPLLRLAQGRPKAFRGGVAGRLAISPDGSKLAFEAQIINGGSPGELFVYERDRGVCTRLSLKEQEQPDNTRCLAMMPAFSPSGDFLAVSARRARPNPAFVSEVRPTLLEYADVGVFPWIGGEARRFGDREYYHSYPTFSPGGDRITAMRSREPLRSGWHAEAAHPIYHGFVEFERKTGAAQPFAGIEFGPSSRFFYETDDRLLVANLPPLYLGVERGMGGLDRDFTPLATYRIERDTVAGANLKPAVPTSFAGKGVDRLCSVDRAGGIWLQSRGEGIKDVPNSASIAMRRLHNGEIESLHEFPGEACTSPCVAQDRPVFAWVTILDGEDGGSLSAVRVHDGPSTELIILNDIFASLQDRIIMT